MKPNITKDSEGRYWCTIPEDQVPDDLATAKDWYTYSGVGCEWNPVEAYNDWLKDCVWEE